MMNDGTAANPSLFFLIMTIKISDNSNRQNSSFTLYPLSFFDEHDFIRCPQFQ